MYSCAEPGQAAIEAAIHEHKLDGVVVASCSPRMHEPTFRRTVERAGLNRYMFEMANIREHVSWIGKDKVANTNKAAELVEMAVAKLRNNKPLFSKSFDINKRVLIIGGGVAGIQAALDCADGGVPVVLVERQPTIGGKMAKLDKTFPHRGLLGLHPGPQDGGRGPASQHHPVRHVGSGRHLRLRGQLHRQDPQARHLCGLEPVHRLRRLHGKMPQQEDA